MLIVHGSGIGRIFDGAPEKVVELIGYSEVRCGPKHRRQCVEFWVVAVLQYSQRDFVEGRRHRADLIGSPSRVRAGGGRRACGMLRSSGINSVRPGVYPPGLDWFSLLLLLLLGTTLSARTPGHVPIRVIDTATLTQQNHNRLNLGSIRSRLHTASTHAS